MAEMAILYDATRCTACRACQVACKQWNELPAVLTQDFGGPGYQNPADLSVDTYVVMAFLTAKGGRDRDEFGNWNFLRRSCMHCTEAPCKIACDMLHDPAKPERFAAIQKSPEGFIWVDTNRCFPQPEKEGGCGGACIQACPFNIPRVGKIDTDGDGAAERLSMRKCKGCVDRLAAGGQPACVKTCGPEALAFGERAAMIKTARARAKDAAVKAKYPKVNIYGAEKPEGGSHVIYVLAQPPSFYGLP
jgi:formate dehydrogenase iron-sulfur subunit